MYELLTLVDEERPFVIVEYPSRVVFTFKRKDFQFAQDVLDRLNHPELIALDNSADVAASA